MQFFFQKQGFIHNCDLLGMNFYMKFSINVIAKNSAQPTASFTKPPADLFLALPGTIPENTVKPSMGNSLWGSFHMPAEWWMTALWIALLVQYNPLFSE